MLLRQFMTALTLTGAPPWRAHAPAMSAFESAPGFVQSGADSGAPALAPGVVIVAAPDNYDHYFCESVLLLLEHDEDKGSRAVLLNHETPWSVAEMNSALTPFDTNVVFLGGDRGADTMLMLHADPSLPGAQPVGAAGVQRGGLAAAAARVAAKPAAATDYKFFYKVSEWLPGMLEREVQEGLWSAVELPAAQLLEQRGHRSMWQRVRDEKVLPRVVPGPVGAERASVAANDRPDAAAPVSAAPASAAAQAQAVPEPPPPLSAAPVGGSGSGGSGSPGVQTAMGSGSGGQGVETLTAGAGSQGHGVTTGSGLQGQGVAAPAEHRGAVAEVLGFRVYLGNTQWRVRWRGYGEADDTWEMWRVVEAEASDEARAQAGRLRAAAGA